MSAPIELVAGAASIIAALAGAAEARSRGPAPAAAAAAAVHLAEAVGAAAQRAAGELIAATALGYDLSNHEFLRLVKAASRLCAAVLGAGALSSPPPDARLLGAAALTLGAAAQALAPICGRQPEQQECAERELLAGLAVVAGQEMGNMEEGALRIAEGLAELRCANLTCPHLPGQRGRLCSGCKLVRFCCPECSKQAWPTHKLACRLLAARRAEAAA